MDYPGKCRHLHGHNGLLEVDVQVAELDALGLAVDFGRIAEVVKTWVDNHLDHNMLLCRRDALVPILQSAQERLFLMDDNPTAECIARLVFEHARELGLPVSEVRLWETPTCKATYRPDLDS
jgi:6-pyruvoyltetrahydropterin/6-carboxytetrahydropterin synthase